MSEQAQATILLVDDDEANLQGFAWIFRQAGFDTLEAATGRDALRLAAQKPDLVVLDVHLPDMSGFEVCRRIKADPATALTPVLHLSAAFVTTEDRVHGLEEGADGYLVKPVAPRELLASVRALLRIKQAEEALRRSEARFRTVFDSAAIGITLGDRDRHMLDCNPAFQQLLGHTREDLLGMTVGDFTHPDDLAADVGLFHELAAGQRDGYQIEKRYLHRDGRVLWGRLTVSRTRTDANPLFAVGMVEDVTEHRRAVAALRESHNLLQAVIEGTPDAVFVKDLQGRYVLINSAAARFVGKAMAEVIGQDDTALVSPETAVRFQEVDRQILASGASRTYEDVETAAGVTRVYIKTKGVYRDDRGQALGIYGISRDITERKRMEEELRASEERFRNLVENVGEGVFQSTPDGRILMANPALARMFGFLGPEEMMAAVSDLGRQHYVDPERREDFRRLVEEQGLVRDFECQVYRKDGSVIWISVTARAVRDPSGSLLRLEGIIEDVTERKRADEALRARARQQEAVAQLGQRALGGATLAVLLDEAAALAARTLEVPLGAVHELLPESQTLLLRAGFGWKDGYAGHDTVGAGPDSQAGYTLLGRAPVVVEDLAEETRFRPSLLLEHGVVSSASVVIHGADQPFGVLLAAANCRRAFSKGDVNFLQAVANVLAAAAERERTAGVLLATQAEILAARKIQQKLFPSSVPRVPGFDIGGASRALDIGGASYPAEAIGGDYFDYISMRDGALGVVVGDVSGHGFGPALLMAEARAYLRALARAHTDVSAILALANRILTEDVAEDRFITLVFARLEAQSRSFTYASAGHLTGYVLNQAGTVKIALPSTGLPLGVVPGAAFPASAPVPLDPGDLILFFTDGITEARSPDEDESFGIDRALAIVRAYRRDSARQIVDNLYYAVRAFSQNLPQLDDITAVVIKVGEP